MDDALLDRRLQEAARYIDDDGFTSAVLARLPASLQQRVSLRAPILLGVALLSSVLAYVLSDGGEFVTIALLRLSTFSPVWLLIICGITGLIVAAGGGVAAVAKMREPQF
jgi:hypothetical protein